MTLFLDACIIIYWVESKPPFYSKLIKTFQEIRNQTPSARFAVSRLSLLECRIKPLQTKDQNLLQLYSDFFSMNDLEIIELDSSVIEIATKLRAFVGLRTPDALQAASALVLDSEVWFLSSDSKFKKVPGLKVRLI